MPSSAVHRAEQQHRADQPARGPAEQGQRPPHAVEGHVDADPGHDRAGRAGRGGVAARQPDLERHQPALDRESGQQQHLRGGPGRAAGRVRERGQQDRVRPGGEQQQPEQQRRPADLAERERDLPGAGAGPVPGVTGGRPPAQQVEGGGQRLPAEQHGERVPRGHDDRDRAEGQRVARAEPARAGPLPPGPASERDRDRQRRAERHGQEQPGQPVGGQAGRPLARDRVAEPARHVQRYQVAGQREPAGRGQAAGPGRADQVQRPGPHDAAAEEVRRRGHRQQDQPAPRIPSSPRPPPVRGQVADRDQQGVQDAERAGRGAWPARCRPAAWRRRRR